MKVHEQIILALLLVWVLVFTYLAYGVSQTLFKSIHNLDDKITQSQVIRIPPELTTSDQAVFQNHQLTTLNMIAGFINLTEQLASTTNALYAQTLQR